MARSRQRICLEQGLRLDLNRVAHSGVVERGTESGPQAFRWTVTYGGETAASGLLTADTQNPYNRCLQIRIGEREQLIYLPATALRRRAMIFRLSQDLSAVFFALDAPRCEIFCQPTRLGAPGCI